MTLKTTQPEISSREMANMLSNRGSMMFQDKEDYVNVKATTTEIVSLSGVTDGSITAYKTGNKININGHYTGWSSGAIGTLSLDYRPLSAVSFGDVTISTTGAITPSTNADDNFSGEYTV